jgi:hypothetical protein
MTTRAGLSAMTRLPVSSSSASCGKSPLIASSNTMGGTCMNPLKSPYFE